jgi:hypothetical protein
MTPITAQTPGFSSRMPDKSMCDFSGQQKPRARSAVSTPIVSSDRKCWHAFAPVQAVALRDFSTAACQKPSIAMRSARGPDGQVSD